MTKQDPFESIRDKRMCELSDDEQKLACELWLREQIGSMPIYHQEHYKTLFSIIDDLRNKGR